MFHAGISSLYAGLPHCRCLWIRRIQSQASLSLLWCKDANGYGARCSQPLSTLTSWSTKRRTSGDLLRNFGGAAVSGFRGLFERLLKVRSCILAEVYIPWRSRTCLDTSNCARRRLAMGCLSSELCL